MAEHLQDEAPTGAPNILGLSFPSRHAYQRMKSCDDGGELSLTDFNSSPHPTEINGGATHRSTEMDADRAVSPTTVGSQQDVSVDDRAVSPVTIAEQGEEPPRTPGILVSPALPQEQSPEIVSAPVPAIRKASRKSRFTEILRRSFSSSWDKSTAFEATRDVPGSGVSYPLGSPGTPQDLTHLHPITEYSNEETRDDADRSSLKYNQPPMDCHSRRDVRVRRSSWLYIMLMILSVYSTLLSGLWFIVSIYQPRYGLGISSSSSHHAIVPSTASLVTALFAKTTELSFVTVFVAFVGQVLTRRAFVKGSQGMTLAEMTMRNWVIQPGSLFTLWDSIPYAGGTFLGFLTLLATISGIFYTTASDAMVTPKLIFGNWEHQELQGLVRASYGNPYFVRDTCTTPINKTIDEWNSAPSCLDVYYSGQSYRNLLAFMGSWQTLDQNDTVLQSTTDIQARPAGTALLYDNTTLYSTWVDAEFSDPAKQFETSKRIINNVTLSMPHPGVYAAATDPVNGILQPNDLSGVGEYQIRASVASPTVNVMCVNIAKSDLAPLIYTEWPDAKNNRTDVPDQVIGNKNWQNDVPVFSDNEWLNKTLVDDVFQWGEKYGRRPPVFQLYPLDYNMITNTSVYMSDSLYLLAKSGLIEDYTLCQLRSWLSPECSTQFNISGISGAQMHARCQDPTDENSYSHSTPGLPETPSVDWKNMADQWRLSMDLNGGITNNNASNARIMTNLILDSAQLQPLLPSMAEALAVLASSTLIIGSIGTSYRQYWDASYPSQNMDVGVYESFNSTLKTQQYASSHVEDWQAIFYPVLGLVFLINVVCLLYLTFAHGMVTDYTEPRNMFALAVNSPPSRQLEGSCGGGPRARELVVPWRVHYQENANHYFFEEGSDKPLRGKWRNSTVGSTTGTRLLSDDGPEGGRYRKSYNRLSSSRTWL
ncbi:hypothetical protein BKA67DRAFT_690250 [Truncatella angustata]|uniref:Mcm2 3 5 family protein n=1 Tax=Truncatella angustata TaxID=152316 RepID=A0A9P8UNL4_9PEZI|nr:uncharacterized protein BKA67DRAFT_690250 [Truncatella angustata]KAH6655455.1 hypothetical protein BKA67DRAFT_690250 [Truncatella angustata]